jgi:hypothetical protein
LEYVNLHPNPPTITGFDKKNYTINTPIRTWEGGGKKIYIYIELYMPLL